MVHRSSPAHPDFVANQFPGGNFNTSCLQLEVLLSHVFSMSVNA
jgi:hypothetical protein